MKTALLAHHGSHSATSEGQLRDFPPLVKPQRLSEKQLQTLPASVYNGIHEFSETTDDRTKGGFRWEVDFVSVCLSLLCDSLEGRKCILFIFESIAPN